MIYCDYSFYTTFGYKHLYETKNKRLVKHLMFIQLQKCCMKYKENK